MQEGLSRAAFYPDPSQRALRAAIAEAEQVSPAWVMAGAGAADVIFGLCYGFGLPGDWCVRPRSWNMGGR